MVIGTFFSEVGLELLERFSDFVENSDDLEKELEISPSWDRKQFDKAKSCAQDFSYTIHLDKTGLVELRDFLREKHTFLLRMLENPNLLENENFTDFLWAVFHLYEELNFREDLTNLPDSDYSHIKGDLKRAYSQIVKEWISYTLHLKENYPYLFSLASRINPMNPHASAVVAQ